MNGTMSSMIRTRQSKDLAFLDPAGRFRVNNCQLDDVESRICEFIHRRMITSSGPDSSNPLEYNQWGRAALPFIQGVLLHDSETIHEAMRWAE